MTKNPFPRTALVAAGVGFLSGPVSGETLFEKLDNAAAGIDHRHTWIDKNRDYANSLNSYASTVGVSLGDYDGDGLLDIFMGDQKDGGNLYRNLGGMKFEDVTAQAGLELDGMWTTGVTFADVNGDSRPDLFLGGFLEKSRLFLNKGDGTFEDVSAGSGLDFNGATTQASFADYDRDGDLDCYLQTNKISAKPGLQVQAQIVDGKIVLPLEARDFKAVLYNAKGEYRVVDSGQQDILLENDGTGKFTDVTQKMGIESAHAPGLSAVWWDVNNDMWPDLYVANDFYLYDELWINQGGKGFVQKHKETFPHQPWFSMGSDFGDLNGDGHFDYVATDMNPRSHFRSKLTMGDMSADSWFLDGADPPQVMRNAVYLNQGQGNFNEVAQQLGMASTGWTWSARIADLDLDGRQDVFFTTGMTRDYENSDLNAILKAELAKVPPGAHMEVARIGKEFWIDRPELKLPNVAYRNVGEMAFDDVSADWGLDEEGVSSGLAIGDLDNDGDPDLVIMNFNSEPSIYRNNSEAKRLKVVLEAEESATGGVGARVIVRRADGSEDHRMVSLMRGYQSSSGTEEIFGFGERDDAVGIRVMWPSGKESLMLEVPVGGSVIVAEKDAKEGRGIPAVAEPKSIFAETMLFEPVVHFENEFDEYKREPLLPQRVSTLGPGLAITDINGDGREDLILAGSKGAASQFAATTERGLASIAETKNALGESMGKEHLAPLIFDADADGDVDILLSSGGTEVEEGDEALRDTLLLNNGSGAMSVAPADALPDLAFSAGAMAAVDYDRDGDLDVFIAGRVVPGKYPTAPRSALLRNDSAAGVAKFTDVTEEACAGLLKPGLVTAVLWSDIDDNGAPDLLLATEWGPVKTFLNNKDGTLTDDTANSGLADYKGWFTSISAGDVDHDGDMDYVVGNFGRNTKYHPTKKKPATLFYGDLDGSGRPQIVEAKVGKEGGLIPVRGKSCSQNAMPFIRKKLPTYEKFARQNLLGIYEKEKLEKALELQANTLDSAILRNDGTGKFTFEPLPAAAQVAPVFGSAFIDVNGDTHLDLVLAQNFYGPQRETGRFNGGVSLVMLGDGQGNFDPLTAAESGLAVHGDATALSVADLDLDKRPDVVIATNNGSVRAFINRSAAKYERLYVIGPPGNRYAAGARLVVKLDDGTKTAYDMAIGGGYLSQSTPWPMVAVPEGRSIAEIYVRWGDGTALLQSVSAQEKAISVEWTKPPAHTPESEK